MSDSDDETVKGNTKAVSGGSSNFTKWVTDNKAVISIIGAILAGAIYLQYNISSQIDVLVTSMNKSIETNTAYINTVSENLRNFRGENQKAIASMRNEIQTVKNEVKSIYGDMENLKGNMEMLKEKQAELLNRTPEFFVSRNID